MIDPRTGDLALLIEELPRGESCLTLIGRGETGVEKKKKEGEEEKRKSGGERERRMQGEVQDPPRLQMIPGNVLQHNLTLHQHNTS